MHLKSFSVFFDRKVLCIQPGHDLNSWHMKQVGQKANLHSANRPSGNHFQFEYQQNQNQHTDMIPKWLPSGPRQTNHGLAIFKLSIRPVCVLTQRVRGETERGESYPSTALQGRMGTVSDELYRPLKLCVYVCVQNTREQYLCTLHSFLRLSLGSWFKKMKRGVPSSQRSESLFGGDLVFNGLIQSLKGSVLVPELGLGRRLPFSHLQGVSLRKCWGSRLLV